MKEIVEQYICDVKRELYRLVRAESYITNLRENLEEYVRQFPDCVYSDLVEQFGTPQAVAGEIIESTKINAPKELAKRRKRNFLFAALAIVVIVFLVAFVVALSGEQILYYSDTTIIIEDEMEAPIYEIER